jgi:hypothetical protein
MENKHLIDISPEQLANVGNGFLAYVKPIAPADAAKLVGEPIALPEGEELFALYGANGQPISIAHSREAAMGSALEHELIPASLH